MNFFHSWGLQYSLVGGVDDESGAASDAVDDGVVVTSVQVHPVDGANLTVRVVHVTSSLIHNQRLWAESYQHVQYIG